MLANLNSWHRNLTSVPTFLCRQPMSVISWPIYFNLKLNGTKIVSLNMDGCARSFFLSLLLSLCVNVWKWNALLPNLECWASVPASVRLLGLCTGFGRCAQRWPRTGRGWSPERLSYRHLRRKKSREQLILPLESKRTGVKLSLVYSPHVKRVLTDMWSGDG